jgi:hypothetical protein
MWQVDLAGVLAGHRERGGEPRTGEALMEEQRTGESIGAAIEVHRVPGPGLLDQTSVSVTSVFFSVHAVAEIRFI